MCQGGATLEQEKRGKNNKEAKPKTELPPTPTKSQIQEPPETGCAPPYPRYQKIQNKRRQIQEQIFSAMIN